MNISLTELVAWRDGAAAKTPGEAFLGLPDAWYDDVHLFCRNGHVSKRYLKSEKHGAICLACRESVVLGPKLDEDEFAAEIAARKVNA
jgi:hypothetical protein